MSGSVLLSGFSRDHLTPQLTPIIPDLGLGRRPQSARIQTVSFLKFAILAAFVLSELNFLE